MRRHRVQAVRPTVTAPNGHRRGEAAVHCILYPERPLERKATVQQPATDWFGLLGSIAHPSIPYTDAEDEAWEAMG